MLGAGFRPIAVRERPSEDRPADGRDSSYWQALADSRGRLGLWLGLETLARESDRTLATAVGSPAPKAQTRIRPPRVSRLLKGGQPDPRGGGTELRRRSADPAESATRDLRKRLHRTRRVHSQLGVGALLQLVRTRERGGPPPWGGPANLGHDVIGARSIWGADLVRSLDREELPCNQARLDSCSVQPTTRSIRPSRTRLPTRREVGSESEGWSFV